MNRRQIKSALKDTAENGNWDEVESWDDNDNKYLSQYIGSFMSLDPCGKYHNILSPNNATLRCERFWENLDSVASELNLWIESGEGDPTDIFLCRAIPESE
jgi:hypothetical protein